MSIMVWSRLRELARQVRLSIPAKDSLWNFQVLFRDKKRIDIFVVQLERLKVQLKVPWFIHGFINLSGTNHADGRPGDPIVYFFE